MRRQVRQLTRATKCLAGYLVMLASSYLMLSIFTYYSISPSLFQKDHFTQDYMQSLYEYAAKIELMKLVHSLLLWLVCVMIYSFVRLNKLLTKKQYA